MTPRHRAAVEMTKKIDLRNAGDAREWIGSFSEWSYLLGTSLLARALGYSHPAVKMFYDKSRGEVIKAEYVEHYPPVQSMVLRRRAGSESKKIEAAAALLKQSD